MKWKGWIWMGSGVVSFLGIAVFLVGNHLIKTAPSIARKVNAPIPVQVAVAQESRLREIIGANGEVRPIEIVNLTATLATRVEKVMVDQGDRVTRGQVLIEFDRDLLEATLKAAQNSADRAEGEMERTKQQYRRVRAVYDQGFSSALVRAARATLDQADGSLERATQQFKRIKAVYDQGLLPKVELEKAQAELEKAKADQSKAEEMLLRARKDTQNELERAEMELAKAKADYSKAEEMLARAEKDLQSARLVAPVSGVVMERLINPGETPSMNQKLLTIGEIGQVLVEAKVAEERVGDIRLNLPATVTLNAFPNDALKGKVVRIKPVTDPDTKTFLVYVEVPNPDLRLIPGLTAFIRVEEEHQKLAVPSVSLINPTGIQESSLFTVAEDGVARLKKVRVGMASGGMTEVLEGLSAGDQVVVVGQLALRDGDLVRIGDEFNELKPKFAENSEPATVERTKSR
jgi:RND family efflux transporter MFP subunit